MCDGTWYLIETIHSNIDVMQCGRCRETFVIYKGRRVDVPKAATRKEIVAIVRREVTA
jgi:hypothetical protein